MSSSETRFPWSALVALALGGFVIINTEFLPVGLLSSIAASYGVSLGLAGLMVSIPGALAALCAPLVLLCCGNVPRRVLLLTFLAVALASNLMLYLAGSLPLAYFSRVLLGVAVGGYWSLAVPFAMSLVDPQRMARAAAIVSTGVSAGTILGVPLGTYLGSLLGWQSAFLINGALALLVLFLLWRYLPNASLGRPVNLAKLGRLVSVRPVFLCLATTTCFAMGHYAAFTYVEPYLKGAFGLGDSQLSSLLMVYGLSGLMGSLVAELFIVRLGPRRTVQLAGALLGSCALAFMLIGGEVALAYLLIALWGCAMGLLPIASGVWRHRLAGDNFQILGALYVTLFQVAVALGPVLGSLANGALGLPACFAVSLLLALLCLWAAQASADSSRFATEKL